MSNPGWWEIALTEDDEKEQYCHADRQEREFCPFFLPCEPKSSCLGENTCAEGYQHLLSQCDLKRATEGTSNETCSTNSQCNGGELGSCTSETPQYCAVCADNGECACASSERCALCSSGSHFREGGECVECPNNEWLIVIAIVLVVVGMIVGGWLANSKVTYNRVSCNRLSCNRLSCNSFSCNLFSSRIAAYLLF